MTTDLGDSGEFWDFNENTNYITIRASDGLDYKVWNHGSESVKKEVANTLAQVRKDINTILVHIMKNPQLWTSKPIAFGIYHTFDIHIPCWSDNMDSILKIKNPMKLINDSCIKMGNLFNYQEMKPDYQNIIGLNKPKKIINIETDYRGKVIDYEIAEKRSIFLTVRNMKSDKLHNYSTILDLAIHELTHTTCNDVRWKKDNHLPPYQSYHTLMRKWAREGGILK
jgi:hypothetical protein